MLISSQAHLLVPPMRSTSRALELSVAQWGICPEGRVCGHLETHVPCISRVQVEFSLSKNPTYTNTSLHLSIVCSDKVHIRLEIYRKMKMPEILHETFEISPKNTDGNLSYKGASSTIK